MHDLFDHDRNNDDGRQVYSVSGLNQEVRQLLEGVFPLIWVEGEISNFSRPGSGHCYFSLKDSDAQVRCAMFRNKAMNLRFQPKDGAHVLLRARVGLYPARGEFQLVVEHMEETGDGRLRRAFEELKRRLQTEGLFEPAGRLPLPALPRRLGVITSPTGAAIHDVLTVLKRRYPALPVLIYPVPVQGAGAAEKIAAAIELAARRAEVDVLLLTRGGGSLEDLWAFNEEIVARAVRACPIPVVAAIGHEVDLTIAELAADLRAPTPSAAAETISPDAAAWMATFARQAERLRQLARVQLTRLQERAAWLRQRIDQHHPQRRLQDSSQQLDSLQLRMEQTMQRGLRELALRRQSLDERLQRRTPSLQISRLGAQTEDLEHRLAAAMRRQLHDKEQMLAFDAHRLDTVSPLATMARGYAVVRHQPTGEILRRAIDAAPGERIVAKLAEGELQCLIEAVNESS
jgi:exodeoxyribonuclease VII large subunit